MSCCHPQTPQKTDWKAQAGCSHHDHQRLLLLPWWCLSPVWSPAAACKGCVVAVALAAALEDALFLLLLLLPPLLLLPLLPDLGLLPPPCWYGVALAATACETGWVPSAAAAAAAAEDLLLLPLLLT
jgi:hypothetical protein